MLAEGLISQKEFEAKRQEIVGEIVDELAGQARQTLHSLVE